MHANAIYALIAVLVIAVAVLGYMLYQERQSDVDVRIDVPEVQVETN